MTSIASTNVVTWHKAHQYRFELIFAAAMLMTVVISMISLSYGPAVWSWEVIVCLVGA